MNATDIQGSVYVLLDGLMKIVENHAVQVNMVITVNKTARARMGRHVTTSVVLASVALDGVVPTVKNLVHVDTMESIAKLHVTVVMAFRVTLKQDFAAVLQESMAISA